MDDAKQYTSSSFTQFKSAMTSMGCETCQKGGIVFTRHGEKVQQKLPSSEIEALYRNGYRDKACCRQLRNILKKYRDVSTNKEELQKELKAKSDIDLVFFGKKDRPCGHMLVDRVNKMVVNGTRALAMDELLGFATPEERLDRIEDLIDHLFTLSPRTIQGGTYDKVRKQRVYIKKGVIHFGGRTRPLKSFMVGAIGRDNRIAWMEKLGPVFEAERDLLHQIFEVNRLDLVALSPEKSTSRMNAVPRLQEIFNEEADTPVRSRFYAENFIIRENGGSIYATSFKRHILINLTEEGFGLDHLKRKPSKKQTNKVPIRSAARPHLHYVKLRNAGGGS